jgi:hypothetical protein
VAGHVKHSCTKSCIVSLAIACLLAAGCRTTRKTKPEVDPATLDDFTFMAYLGTQPIVTVDEGMRAVLILADGRDAAPPTFQARSESLATRGIIRPQWGLRPDDAIDKGTAGYMIMKVCRIPGGVDMLLFGSWGLGDRRYAFRELIYLGMLTQGVDYEVVTGPELVSLLSKADERLEAQKLAPRQAESETPTATGEPADQQDQPNP